jgi:hypothetical protein
MSTSFEKIFTPTTILKLLEVHLNDEFLNPEDILSLEVSSSFEKPFVEGTIILKDSFNISELDLFDGKTTLTIYGNDIHDEKMERKFRIISIKVDEENERFQKYVFGFVDEIYYKLKNTFISKSFSSDPITAFNEYIDHLSLNANIQQDKLTLNTDNIDAYNFIVPQDRSVLDFLSYEFAQNGLNFWQDNTSINIKNINFSELEFIKNIDGEDAIYTNNTTNNNYAFKIQDYSHEYNNILDTNIKKPIIEHLSYDIEKKVIDRTTKNLEDVYDDIKLNDKELRDLQHTTGMQYVTDINVFENKQMLELKNTFVKNNMSTIVVPGNYKFNKIGKLINVQLKANPYMDKYVSEGDTFHSGVYFIYGIKDRYIGDKLVQQLKIYRMDQTQVRG